MKYVIMIISAAFLVYCAILEYTAWSKYTMLQGELNKYTYRIITVGSDQISKVDSITYKKAPFKIQQLANTLDDLKFSNGLDGLVEAMNCKIPNWDWFDNDSNKLNVQRAMLKGLVAPITNDKCLYVLKSSKGGIKKVFHRYKSAISEYSENNSEIVLGIKIVEMDNTLFGK
jgi:hypothetical protein